MYRWSKTISLASSTLNCAESQTHCRRKSLISGSYSAEGVLAKFVKREKTREREGREKKEKKKKTNGGWNLAGENNDPSIRSTIINCGTQLELSTPLLAYGWTNDVPVSCRIDRSADRHHGCRCFSSVIRRTRDFAWILFGGLYNIRQNNLFHPQEIGRGIFFLCRRRIPKEMFF